VQLNLIIILNYFVNNVIITFASYIIVVQMIECAKLIGLFTLNS